MLGLTSNPSICPPTLHLSLPTYEMGQQLYRTGLEGPLPSGVESAHPLLWGPLEASRFGGRLCERVGTMRTAGAAHREGGTVTMESQGREDLSEHTFPPQPCKDWETEAQGGAGPQDSSSYSPVCNVGVPGSAPPPGRVSFVL